MHSFKKIKQKLANNSPFKKKASDAFLLSSDLKAMLDWDPEKLKTIATYYIKANKFEAAILLSCLAANINAIESCASFKTNAEYINYIKKSQHKDEYLAFLNKMKEREYLRFNASAVFFLDCLVAENKNGKFFPSLTKNFETVDYLMFLMLAMKLAEAENDITLSDPIKNIFEVGMKKIMQDMDPTLTEMEVKNKFESQMKLAEERVTFFMKHQPPDCDFGSFPSLSNRGRPKDKNAILTLSCNRSGKVAVLTDENLVVVSSERPDVVNVIDKDNTIKYRLQDPRNKNMINQLLPLSNNRFVSATEKMVTVWNATTQKHQSPLDFSSTRIRAITTLPNDHIIVILANNNLYNIDSEKSATYDTRFNFIDEKKGEAAFLAPYYENTDHNDFVIGYKGKEGANATVEVIDGQTYKVKRTYSPDSIRTLTTAKNGDILLLTKDKEICICNEGMTVIPMNEHKLYMLAPLPKGLIAGVSITDEIKILDLNKNGECLATLTGHKDIVATLTADKDGTIISASLDGEVHIWPQGSYMPKEEKEERVERRLRV